MPEVRHNQTRFLARLALVAVAIGAGVALGIGMGAADEPPVHPHPVVAWPAGPFEVKVAFDRPLDPAVPRSVEGRLIPFEEEASVIQQARPKAKQPRPSRVQLTLPHRGTLRIAAARLEDDGRSLRLVTDPQPRVATYSLHLAGIRAPGQPAPGESIDLLYGLGGVEAAWDDGGTGAKPAWTGWWPDLDPGIVRRLTIGSLDHERSLVLLSRPGRLVLRTRFVLPRGRHTLRLASNVAIAAEIAGTAAVATDQPGGAQTVEHAFDSTGAPVDLRVTLRTGVGTGPTTFRASYFKQENPTDLRLSHARLLVPWASTTPGMPDNVPALPKGMAGGDPSRGESVFFGEKARCSSCHAIGGKGGTLGPELGHQFERPTAEVYRDIAEPGFWINPNYVAYTVALKDGRNLVGIVRAEGADSVRVTDNNARATVVRRAEIEALRPSPSSIMPVGLGGTLADGPLRDLLAFLTQPPPGTASR